MDTVVVNRVVTVINDNGRKRKEKEVVRRAAKVIPNPSPLSIHWIVLFVGNPIFFHFFFFSYLLFFFFFFLIYLEAFLNILTKLKQFPSKIIKFFVILFYIYFINSLIFLLFMTISFFFKNIKKSNYLYFIEM